MAVSLPVDKQAALVEAAAKELESEVKQQMITTAEKIIELMVKAYDELWSELVQYQAHRVNLISRLQMHAAELRRQAGYLECQECFLIEHALLPRLRALNAYMDQWEAKLK